MESPDLPPAATSPVRLTLQGMLGGLVPVPRLVAAAELVGKPSRRLVESWIDSQPRAGP
jgi:hypothetical protein